MEAILLSIIEKFGYLGILLLIAIENIFPPIPSEVILLFSGFMTTYTKLNIIYIILFSLLGSLIGAFVLYIVGRVLNKDRLKIIIKGKVGRILHLKSEDIDKANSWFDSKGGRAVFFTRFIPIVRSLISIPAGMNKMNPIKFFLYTILGSLIWNSVFVILGRIMGDNWISVANIVDKYSNLVFIIFMVILLILGILYYNKRIKTKRKIEKKEKSGF